MLQIVTAELKAESNRDVVIYKIRVGDDTGEWTVSRRFRNFETLHRALRCPFNLPSTLRQHASDVCAECSELSL